ncbi:Trm112 family protein [Streptomyces chartreusis]|uniref:Trm112 family protein n=1 Tax=Streptomyces chartreusis TaxID=1969 RepID=UPI0033C5F95E
MEKEDPLLKLLVCPLDKGTLILNPSGNSLYNPRLCLRYPVIHNVPQLLPTSGEPVSDEEITSLTSHPHTLA